MGASISHQRSKGLGCFPVPGTVRWSQKWPDVLWMVIAGKKTFCWSIGLEHHTATLQWKVALCTFFESAKRSHSELSKKASQVIFNTKDTLVICLVVKALSPSNCSSRPNGYPALIPRGFAKSEGPRSPKTSETIRKKRLLILPRQRFGAQRLSVHQILTA